jgi:dynein intermediate chain
MSARPPHYPASLIPLQVPVVTTPVGANRALNKLKWDSKDGRRAAMGGSDGKLYIYDIGDMAIPRETEWAELQKVISGMSGGQGGAALQAEADSGKIVAGR